ncbi:MAG: DUF2066 domain-containing protein [Micavibrio sp.]
MARQYRFLNRITSAHIPFLGILFSGLIFFSGIAQAEDPLFTVSGVKVDITAASAVEAKQQGLEKAQQDAFVLLASRLLPEAEAAAFTPPPSNTISPMVKDFEITDERLSRVQYIGTYTFRFKDNAIRAYFNDKNVSYSDIRSKPVLILPFIQLQGSTQLWDGQNQWLAAWGRTDSRQGLVPVQIPIGDISDVNDIKDNEALTYNNANLQNMISRYGAGEAILAIAHPKRLPAQAETELPAAIDIMLYRTDLGAPTFVKAVTVETKDMQGEESIYDTAVRLTRQTFQTDWKTKTSVSADQSYKLKARVQFATLPEWAATQKALRQVSAVTSMRVISLTPRQAEIELSYSGSEDRLRLALMQQDIVLSSPSYGSSPYDGSMNYDVVYNLQLKQGRTTPTPVATEY